MNNDCKIVFFLYRKNFLSTVFVTLVLIALVITQLFSEYQYQLRYEQYVKPFISNNYVNNQSFYYFVEQEYTKAAEKTERIYNLSGKNDKNAVDILMGHFNLSQNDLDWINEQLQKPGVYTDTVEDDFNMLSQLHSDIQNQMNIETNKSNNIKLLTLNLNRISTDTYEYQEYKKLINDYQKINTAHAFIYTRNIDQFIKLYNNDLIFLFIAVLLAFGIFSAQLQNKQLSYIVTTRCGIERYVALKYIVCLMNITTAFLIYTGVYIGYMISHNIDSGMFSAPIQVLDGFDNSIINITVFQYIIILILFKFLFVLMMGSLFTLASLLTRKNILSVVACLGLAAVPFFINWLSSHIKDIQTYLSNIKSGAPIMAATNNINAIMGGINYINVMDRPVSFAYLYFIIIIAIIALCMTGICLLSKLVVVKG